MRLAVYVGLLTRAEAALAESYRQVGNAHGDEPDIAELCRTLAAQCDAHEEALRPVVERYGEQPDEEPDRLHADALGEGRSGPLGMLRDLQDLSVLAHLVDTTWTLVKQAGLALRDEELLGVVADCESETAIQLQWLSTRMKQAAPQALVTS